jgi:galactokinase
MDNDRIARIKEAFTNRFSGAPNFIARAPGRVNLIGEHTDYNDGFVLPCALSFDVLIAFRPRPDERVVVHSLNFDSDTSFPLDNIDNSGPPWSHYLKGVAKVLMDEGHTLRGLDMVTEGNVPVGSGLSSSAAIEVAVAHAYLHAAGVTLPEPEIARLCQKAENEFVGLPCGIMDQFASANCRAGHALFLDCRDLSFEHIPFDPEAHGLKLVVTDTGRRRKLTESVYEQRVKECAAAVTALQPNVPGIKKLRDVHFDVFQVNAPHLDPVIRKRARHVITENARTEGAVQAMRIGALEGLGALMNQSHDSLRDDYECTGPHLDAMVEECRKVPGVVGSRMTGAGFGGCTVTLVRQENLDELLTDALGRYKARLASGELEKTDKDKEPQMWVVSPAAGAEVLPA